MKTRILLADDHVILRQGLRNLVDAEPDLEVVGEAGHGRDAVELAATLKPDVVVTDLGMPELNGIDATRRIVAGTEHVTRVVVLSMHADPRFIRETFRAGASGYVVKDAAFEELVEAIRTVSAGRRYVSARVSHLVGDAGVGGEAGAAAPGGRDVFAVLSPREREVLQLLSEGQATKQAAHTLHLSVKTVETHRRNLMEKLNLHSVAELTKYAIREGLTTTGA